MNSAELQKITEMIGELEEEKLMEYIDRYLNNNPDPKSAQEVISACQQGMEIVGEHFQTGEYFVGDLIFSGELITDVINKLKSVMGEENSQGKGTILLGTVYGDIHDVGKNIFKTMSEAAGFRVIDIGIDQSAESFVEKAKEINPDIIGMSGVLSLAIESMKDTVEKLNEAGMRSRFKIIIGGNPVTEEACKYIGADAYTINALKGVEICRKWIEERKN